MKPLVSVTLALLTSLVFVAPEARGSTILLDCTASTIPTLTNSAPSATSNITCPQFNSGFGTLTQYTLVSGAGTPQTIPTGSITIQNLTGSPISGGGGVFYTWNLSTFAGYTTSVGTDTVTGVNLGPNATGTFHFTAFSAIAIRTFPPQPPVSPH